MEKNLFNDIIAESNFNGNEKFLRVYSILTGLRLNPQHQV